MPAKTLRTRRDISISRCGTPAMLGAPPGMLLCCTPGTTAMPISCVRVRVRVGVRVRARGRGRVRVKG